MAIGPIISVPFPWEVSTGIKAIIVVAAVNIAGLTLLDAANNTASLILLFVLGLSFSNFCLVSRFGGRHSCGARRCVCAEAVGRAA